jgi:small neutral amino acid transporter SnatA (MarC family)
MVDSLLSSVLLAVGSLLAVPNPFSVVPPFVAMAVGNTVHERKTMARPASAIAAGVLVAFALVGLPGKRHAWSFW